MDPALMTASVQPICKPLSWSKVFRPVVWMRVSRVHGMTNAGALTRVDALLPQLLGQFGSQVSDVHHHRSDSTMEFSFSTRGFHLNGTLEVTDNTITLDMGIPLLLRPLQGHIEATVREKLADYYP